MASAGSGLPQWAQATTGSLSDGTTAVGAEMRSPDERRATGTAICLRHRPLRQCGERTVELLDPLFDADELRALLEEELRLQPVALVHLEHQPAEIADPVLTRADERTPFPPHLAGRRRAALLGRRGRRGLLGHLPSSWIGLRRGAPHQTVTKSHRGRESNAAAGRRAALGLGAFGGSSSESDQVEHGEQKPDGSDRDPDERDEEEQPDANDDKCECDSDHAVELPASRVRETREGSAKHGRCRRTAKSS